jgi:hypothetical protein
MNVWTACGVVVLLILHAIALYAMGQPWMYEGGYVKFWHGVVISGENSQHLTDWYTLSHVIHGLLFYAGLSFFFPRLSVGLRLLFALLIESSWELFENTDMIINRYREQALAQGYFGDSIVLFRRFDRKFDWRHDRCRDRVSCCFSYFDMGLDHYRHRT